MENAAALEQRAVTFPGRDVVDRTSRQADPPPAALVGPGVEEQVFVSRDDDERIHTTADVERPAAGRQDRVPLVASPLVHAERRRIVRGTNYSPSRNHHRRRRRSPS